MAGCSLLDPAHATKAAKIQATLTVLGKQMTLEVRDAAPGGTPEH